MCLICFQQLIDSTAVSSTRPGQSSISRRDCEEEYDRPFGIGGSTKQNSEATRMTSHFTFSRSNREWEANGTKRRCPWEHDDFSSTAIPWSLSDHQGAKKAWMNMWLKTEGLELPSRFTTTSSLEASFSS